MTLLLLQQPNHLEQLENDNYETSNCDKLLRCNIAAQCTTDHIRLFVCVCLLPQQHESVFIKQGLSTSAFWSSSRRAELMILRDVWIPELTKRGTKTGSSQDQVTQCPSFIGRFYSLNVKLCYRMVSYRILFFIISLTPTDAMRVQL